MNCVRDIRNCKKAVIGSDHYLIVLKFTAKLPKLPWKERIASKRFDIPKLKDPIVRQRFSECIEEKLNEIKEEWTSDVDADWSLLSSTVTEVAEEVLGRPPVTERKDWFDEECREQAAQRRAAEKALYGLPSRTRAQQRAADEARENYRAINRECNRFFRRKRREYLNERVEEI
jgi:hypothetical protein